MLRGKLKKNQLRIVWGKMWTHVVSFFTTENAQLIEFTHRAMARLQKAAY